MHEGDRLLRISISLGVLGNSHLHSCRANNWAPEAPPLIRTTFLQPLLVSDYLTFICCPVQTTRAPFLSTFLVFVVVVIKLDSVRILARFKRLNEPIFVVSCSLSSLALPTWPLVVI